jgi:hypothetical protein
MARTNRTGATIVESKTREMVKERLADIITDLPVEDVLFLEKLVVNYYSFYPGDSLGIVNAFEVCVRDRGFYILLPNVGLRDPVMEFIHELTHQRGRLQPKGNGWHLWKNPQAKEQSTTGPLPAGENQNSA